MVLEDLESAQSLGELWADSGVEPDLLSESFNNVTMTFNTQEGTVTVISELLNQKNEPMFEWKMTPALNL